MVPTAACSAFLSRSHAATIWQSGCFKKTSVLAGPIMPQPITPMVMRSEAGARPARANALRESTAAAAAACMNLRRDNCDCDAEGRIVIDASRAAARVDPSQGLWRSDQHPEV